MVYWFSQDVTDPTSRSSNQKRAIVAALGLLALILPDQTFY